MAETENQVKSGRGGRDGRRRAEGGGVGGDDTEASVLRWRGQRRQPTWHLFPVTALLRNQNRKQKHHADSTLSHSPRCRKQHLTRKFDAQTTLLQEELSASGAPRAFNRPEGRLPSAGFLPAHAPGQCPCEGCDSSAGGFTGAS